MLAHARPRLLFAALLAVLLLLVGCAEVERTVTAREVVVEEGSDPRRIVAWDSNRYSRLEVDPGDECWDEAVIGQPPPEVCLSTSVLGTEADPFRWSRLLTTASALGAIGALFWYANRRIGWQPTVDRATGGDGARRSLNSSDAVNLMRGISQEKQSQHIAKRARRDLGRPALVGLFVAAAVLIPLIGLTGYGTGLGWGAVTGVILMLGVGAGFIVLLVPLPPMPSDYAAYSARLLFFGGIAAGLLIAAAIGLSQRTPLVELDGIAWLG